MLSRTSWLFALAISPLVSLWLLWPSRVEGVAPLRIGKEVIYKLWTKAALVDHAAIHASKYPEHRRRYLRYVDLGGITPEKRASRIRVLGYVVNSWSSKDLIVLPGAVPGTQNALAFFDLSDLGIDPKVFDRLGELGSGPVPRAEPIYHAKTADCHEEKEESYTERVIKKDSRGNQYVQWDSRLGRYVPVYETVTRKRKSEHKKAKVALGPHLNRATAIGLAALCETEFPIYEYRWLIYNGLVEPRYHELLYLDDTEASVKKLALVKEEEADRIGSQLRGAVLISEVAHHNRILERSPTPRKHGKGSYWASLDFGASDRENDVLKDLLNNKPAAREIIFTLANGLQGFFVVDGKGKRLDKADGDVANNRRFLFRDSQVRTAYHCIACHLPDAGFISIEDEVREQAKKTVTLFADRLDSKDRNRSEKIRQKYLSDDINELIRDDSVLVERAVRTATGGLTSKQTAKILTEDIASYLQDSPTVESLSLQLGYTKTEVLAAMQVKGVDPVFTVLRGGRRVRRDQVEAGFVQLATILYLGSHRKTHGED